MLLWCIGVSLSGLLFFVINNPIFVIKGYVISRLDILIGIMVIIICPLLIIIIVLLLCDREMENRQKKKKE